MSAYVDEQLETMWRASDADAIDETLEAFARLKQASTKSDLHSLLNALKSERSNFWVRELLAEPIAELGGCACLPELLDALQRGDDDGHDNDGFCSHLVSLAHSDPAACRNALVSLLAKPGFRHKEAAEWLLEYCEVA